MPGQQLGRFEMRQMLGVLASVAAAVALDGCNGTTDVRVLNKIDRLQAYYCATPGQNPCTSRGDPIPDGTLPPLTESFQVWAFYRGWLTTYWLVTANGDSANANCCKFQPDSTHVYLGFNGGGAAFYTVHVFIKGAAGLITNTDDSLRWNYTH
jgi:hypothetical protein